MHPQAHTTHVHETNNDSQDARRGPGPDSQSRSGIQFGRNPLDSIHVTTPPTQTANQNCGEGGLRPGFYLWGSSSPKNPSADVTKLTQVENIGKAYAEESSKFCGGRDEELGSMLLTFHRNLKLYLVDEEQWVSVIPLMLKQSALCFFEDHIEKKDLVDNFLFHYLVNLFKNEFSTTERENELWL